MRRTCVLAVLVVVGFSLTSLSDEPGSPALIARPDAFKTLVNPNCSHCVDEAKRRAADLKADDRVLCWIRGKYDGGAIPYRFFLAPYRVISDTYGVFVYDADAGFVRGFEPSLDFTFYGWRNGVMVIKHKDGTLYSALTGVAFDGPNKGQQLKTVPTLETNWGYWMKAYRDTVAYHMYDKYQPIELPTKLHEDSVRSRPKPDPRLAPDTPVLGVRMGAPTKAYPLSLFGKTPAVLPDPSFAGGKTVVFWYPATNTAAAYYANIRDGEEVRQLTFTVDEKNPLAPFLDQELGSRWDITGRAVDGPLKGKTLEWLDGVQVKWFAWAAEYPQTGIYGAR